MGDITSETPEELEAKLNRVLRNATVTDMGAFVWREITDLHLATLPAQALAYVRGQHSWSALVPSSEESGDALHVIRINFPQDQDNSGFVGWLATRLKAELGTGVVVVCGLESRNGGIFDYWCLPRVLARDALELLKDWRTSIPDTGRTHMHSTTGPQQWLRLPITMHIEGTAFTVRRARRDEFEAVVDLIASDSFRPPVKVSGAGATNDPWTDLTRFETGPDNIQLVVVLHGDDELVHEKVVGCMQATRIAGLFRDGESRIHLEATRVAASYRGHGLGSQLIREVIANIVDSKIQMVQLMSDVRREDAARFYERLGFVATHRAFKMSLAPS